MIDLHLHTYYSDGTLSPTELVQRAWERGVATIAISDHDGLDGVAEGIKAGEQFGITVIPGIELSTAVSREEILTGIPGEAEPDIFLHILGHDIDVNNVPLNQAIQRIRKQRENRNRIMLATLNRMGFAMSESDLDQHHGKGYVGKPNFALALANRGYIKTPKEAFTPGQFLRHPEIRKIHREKVHVKEAISLIHQAGGQPVLAHPLKIGYVKMAEEGMYDRLDQLLFRLKQWGLSGLECHYSTHTPTQAAKLVEMAEAKGLVVTSGSDFHGPEFDTRLDVGVVVDTTREPISGPSNEITPR